MDPLTFTLVIAAVCTLYYYLKKRLHYFKDRGIPYAPWTAARDLAKFLLRRKHVTEMLLDIYHKFPGAKYIGAFEVTMQPTIFVRDPDLIKTIAIKHFDSFQNHLVVFDAKLDPLFGGNLVNMVDDHWREARNMLSPAFTSSKMKAMFPLMVENAKNCVDYLSELLPHDNTMAIDTKDMFTKYTNDVIASCAFGLSVDSFRNPDNEFYTFGRKITNFEGFGKLKIVIAIFLPQLVKLFKMKFVNETAAKFFKDTVANVVKTRDEQGINRPDMIQLMMSARGTEKKHLKLGIEEMTAQAFIFFFAGFETTSTQMCLLAHQLAINSDIQKRLQNEIDNVLKETNGSPTYDAIQGMAYLDAVFNESMRRNTQAIVLDRVCNKPFELPPALPGAKPFLVPKDMKVTFSGLGIHSDSNYYEDPEKFDPDRYYLKKVGINDEMNLGFGIGPRMCIGNRFAILETKVVLFHLLSKFNLVPTATTCSPLKYDRSKFSLAPEGGYKLVVERRNQDKQ